MRRVASFYKSVRVRKTAVFKLTRWKPTRKTTAPSIMSCGGGVLGYGDFGMVGSVRDYAQFCQMLLSGGQVADGPRVLRTSTVKTLWRDGLTPFQCDGRLPGWNDSEEGMRDWDKVGWSLLNSHLCFKSGPCTVSRRGHTMWMGGGGGAYWSINKQSGIASLSFAPVFGGRCSEDDGLGPLANDASLFATDAWEGRKERRRAEKKRYS